MFPSLSSLLKIKELLFWASWMRFRMFSLCQYYNTLHVPLLLIIHLFVYSDLFSPFIRQGCKHKRQGSHILIHSVIWPVEWLVLGQIWYVRNNILLFLPSLRESLFRWISLSVCICGSHKNKLMQCGIFFRGCVVEWLCIILNPI